MARREKQHISLVALTSFALLGMGTVWQANAANAQSADTGGQQAATQDSQQSQPATLKPVVVKPAPRKPAAPKVTSASAAATETVSSSAEPARTEAPKTRKPSTSRGIKGPYYVDFRARTAASYGHAFVWFGKSTDKKVDVAGLHPAGDAVPFVLGHLIPVPAETGASYGDLDPQYLTASYKVYMSAADAKRVFAHIRKLQATTKFWNEATSSCTTFMGQIASFMGLKTPFYMQKPEDYVNALRDANNGVDFIKLSPEVSSLEQ